MSPSDKRASVWMVFWKLVKVSQVQLRDEENEGLTSGGQFTPSVSQINCNRDLTETSSRGLKRNFAHLDANGSMMLQKFFRSGSAVLDQCSGATYRLT